MMTTKEHGTRVHSVWDALEDTPSAAQSMQRRSELMIAIKAHITAKQLDQVDAAHVLGVTPRCVSELLRGRIGQFTLETLAGMARTAGIRA